MIISNKILFAQANDEEGLREILLGYGMDISGEIEDHLIVKEGDEILAGGKIIEYQVNHFYLEILVANQENCGQGLGGYLLREVIKDPGKYCKTLLIQGSLSTY